MTRREITKVLGNSVFNSFRIFQNSLHSHNFTFLKALHMSSLHPTSFSTLFFDLGVCVCTCTQCICVDGVCADQCVHCRIQRRSLIALFVLTPLMQGFPLILELDWRPESPVVFLSLLPQTRNADRRDYPWSPLYRAPGHQLRSSCWYSKLSHVTGHLPTLPC